MKGERVYEGGVLYEKVMSTDLKPGAETPWYTVTEGPLVGPEPDEPARIRFRVQYPDGTDGWRVFTPDVEVLVKVTE